MIEYFSDWGNVTGTFQQLTVTKNAAGQPVESWVNVSGGISIALNYWVDSAIETNTTDKFIDKKTGAILLKYGILTPDTTMRVVINSVNHHITGVDNVAMFNYFYYIKWVATVE